MSYPLSDMSYPLSGMSYPLCDMSYSLCDMSYPLSDMSYPLSDMSYPLSDMPYPLSGMSYPLCDMSYLSVTFLTPLALTEVPGLLESLCFLVHPSLRTTKEPAGRAVGIVKDLSKGHYSALTKRRDKEEKKPNN